MVRQAGEDYSFDEFVAARARSLFRTAYLLVHHRESAEDLVQSALERAYPRWRRIQGMGAPEAYIRRIIVNLANEQWRSRKGVHWQELDDDHQPRLVPPNASDAADPADRVATRDALMRALRALPFGMRAALVLRHWEGLTERETADVLGVSVGTVKSQTNRGLERLRAAVGPPGALGERTGPGPDPVPALCGPPSRRRSAL
ncbi:SigE family RNA polymerase sigma factor [Catenulispora yoronensis]|uniref:SigE family RNA polymerase sigma factor n=1 Tax=Catenulispora yoronensis TaxID=450799 RepID=A0ABN2U9Q6_9ACTN